MRHIIQLPEIPRNIDPDATTLSRYIQQHLGWSSVQQVFRVTRSRTTRDRETGIVSTSTEVAYGISSLSRGKANAETLLELNRGHWGIENQTHYVRDETFAEDRC